MTLRLRIILAAYRALGWLKRWGALAAGVVLAVLTLGVYRRKSAELTKAADEQRKLSEQDRSTAQALSDASRDALRARADRLADEAAKSEAAAARHNGEIIDLRKAVNEMSDAEIVREHQRRARAWRNRAKLLPLALVLSLASRVDAQSEPTEAPHPITHERGLWMPFGYARELLADVEELELERAHLAELQRILRIRAEESAELRRSLDVAEATIGELAAHDAVTSRRAREAEQDAATQRRRRWWWFGAGVVLGIGATASLAVSL